MPGRIGRERRFPQSPAQQSCHTVRNLNHKRVGPIERAPNECVEFRRHATSVQDDTARQAARNQMRVPAVGIVGVEHVQNPIVGSLVVARTGCRLRNYVAFGSNTNWKETQSP